MRQMREIAPIEDSIIYEIAHLVDIGFSDPSVIQERLDTYTNTDLDYEKYIGYKNGYSAGLEEGSKYEYEDGYSAGLEESSEYEYESGYLAGYEAAKEEFNGR